MRYAALLLLASCAKPVPIEDYQSQIGASLLVAAPIARMVASEADRGDGAVGCIVGEVLGSTFRAAGRQLATGQHDPHAAVNVCECLAMREDWSTVDIPTETASGAAEAIEAVSLLVSPYIRDCESRAWFVAATGAVADLVVPLSEALALDLCAVPIPAVAPDLEACDG